MHARQQIREALGLALTGLALTGSRVYPNRLYSLPSDLAPSISVFTGSERQSGLDEMGSDSFRVLSIVIEIRVKSANGVDATLDTICADVENAISADQTIGGAVKDIEYQSTEIGLDSETEKPIALGRISYDALYRIDPKNSNTIIG